MKSEKAEKLNAQLEPVVGAMLPEAMERHISDGTSTLNLEVTSALFSIAISLKRIADMLDGTTLGLNCAETIFNPATVQNRDVRNHY